MTAAAPSTVTRGFLFADLRGYTAFAEKHGDDAAVALLNTYRQIVRGVIARFDGAEIRTEGDAFYVVFSSASRAVEGGLALLAEVALANEREPARPIHVGVGVHAGETSETGEGPVGSAVNIAARVCAQAHAGELLVTDTVRSLTRTRLPVRFTPRGSPRLKGITEPIGLFAVESTADPAAQASQRARGVGRRTAAAVAVVTLAALSGLGLVTLRPPATAAPSPADASSSAVLSAGGSPTAEPLACFDPSTSALPVVADVPFYRANVDRTSIYPGPGPICVPHVAWQQSLGVGADFVPITVDGKVIVGDAGGLHAFDAHTGLPSWTVPSSPGVDTGGFREGAVAVNHVVFALDVGGTLYAIDVASGAKRWTAPVPNDGLAPTFANGLLWLGSSDGHAHAFDPATGDERWTWEGPANSIVHVDLVTADTAYIDVGSDLIAIRLVDQKQLWRFPSDGIGLTSAVLAGDTVYVGVAPGAGTATQGALHALDRLTGRDRWRPFVIAGGGQVGPGPVKDGIVYAMTNGDGVYALRDSGSEYQIVWHNPDVSATSRPSSLSGSVLYVQQHGGALLALRADDGTKMWAADINLPGTETPVVTGGYVFQVDDEEATLRAWAEPALTALLPSPRADSSSSADRTTSTPSPSATLPPNPFEIVKSIPFAGSNAGAPVAMAAGNDGLVYILHDETGNDPRVTVVDPRTANVVHAWGRYGSGRGEFDLSGNIGNPPTGCIDVAPNGNVYVGEYGNARVQIFTPEGKFVSVIGGLDAPTGALGPVYFCRVAPDGSLFTVTEGGVLSKYDADGHFEFQVPGKIHGIAFRPDGLLLALQDAPGRGLIVNPNDGNVVDYWGTGGNAPGQIGGSGELTVDANGNVYVFRYVFSALQVFDVDGVVKGGMYAAPGTYGEVGPCCLSDNVFWPPPVFTPDGAGYTFGAAGLVQIRTVFAP